ncbi:MAG: hypothetical protein HOP08_05690 [Cyclobacteriaceae bacterium]|nr:hypothetical protein [Cyclobacteriaceae bacterium]
MVLTFIIVLSILAIIVAAISILILLPVLFIKWRASIYGLSLTLTQAKVISDDYCNSKVFYRSVKDIWFWEEVPIEKLTIHYLLRKDLTNLRDGIIEMKQKNAEIQFNTLATFDLVGRNLKEEIRKAELNNWTFRL